MKIISKIKIHFFFYVVLFLSILTGRFKTFFAMTIITIFHELGHIITSLIFNWKIDKILVMPISLLTIYNVKINTKKYQELIVTIMGPIAQMFLFFVIKDEQILKYNLMLLLFNLLPIYPLDGSKIFKIVLYDYLPFKYVESVNIYVSVITIILLLLVSKWNLIIIFVCVLFIFKAVEEYKKRKYVFNKFLFERYLYKIKYKKNKIINGLKKDDFYKNYHHNFITKNKIVTEEEFLSKMFDNTGVL